jgi:hypothetical protein
MAGSGLTGLAKARWESQLIKTDRALADYAGQLAQDDLLLTRLPDKVQKAKWLKPKKSHDKVSKRLMTGTKAAERAADKAERAAKRPAVPRPVEESDDEDVVVPGTPPRTAPIVEESQGGDTIFVKPLASYKDPGAFTTTARCYTYPRSFPGNIPGTGRVTGIDSACKDGRGAF